jgi:PAS domain-containing protein
MFATVGLRMKTATIHIEAVETSGRLWRTVFDAIPHPAFIMDEDTRVRNFNVEAEKLLGTNPKSALWQRGGEALHCIYADQLGCGKSPACRHCVIRTSVRDAFSGLTTRRKYFEAELRSNRGHTRVSMFVSVQLLPDTQIPQVLVILENLKETLRLYKQHHGL